ncbi:hypothetical protein ACLB2K_041172 [Fragaria x ananassa]
MTGVSVIVPSPSGAKLLVVRNPEYDEAPCQFEIWGLAQVEKEFHIPQSVHGSVYADEWEFLGILMKLSLLMLLRNHLRPSQHLLVRATKKGSTTDENFANWKGQGEWEEEWGETYVGKGQPALFVININSGETQTVRGIEKHLSVGQVVWAPAVRGSHQFLVFVGWSANTRKLGIKYCHNRPCALYAVKAPLCVSEDGQDIISRDNSFEDFPVVNLTQSTSSAYHPRFSGEVLHISPTDSNFSWNALSLDEDNIIAVSSSLVDVPRIKYGYLVDRERKSTAWNWLDVPSPTNECSEKFSIMKIPVRDVSDSLTKGARNPFEAIFVSFKTNRSDSFDPLIVFIHGGPHTVSSSSFSKSLAFLSAIGFNLLLVNYRGSLGFGEEALQSLPGNIGSQDVNDILVAIDHVIYMGLASPSKMAVLGGSHGGFLTTHLIGQAPDKFFAAAARNPACNLALMVSTTDIPDWCSVEAYGTEGKNRYTEAPSAEHLALFHSKSPISLISKAKTPTHFLLGAQDIRLPICSGLQYARALKEKGVAVKVIVFPNDNHPMDRPQSDFESFLNSGVWFKRYFVIDEQEFGSFSMLLLCK